MPSKPKYPMPPQKKVSSLEDFNEAIKPKAEAPPTYYDKKVIDSGDVAKQFKKK